MDTNPTHYEVIPYGVYRFAAVQIRSATTGDSIEDADFFFNELFEKDGYYEIAEANCDCANMGGMRYHHLWYDIQSARDFGVIMPTEKSCRALFAGNIRMYIRRPRCDCTDIQRLILKEYLEADLVEPILSSNTKRASEIATEILELAISEDAIDELVNIAEGLEYICKLLEE